MHIVEHIFSPYYSTTINIGLKVWSKQIRTLSNRDVIVVAWRDVEVVVGGDWRFVAVVDVDLEADASGCVRQTVVGERVQPQLDALRCRTCRPTTTS